jgi:hypothetical protein
MRITFMICNQRGILVEALGKPIALLCEFVEELEGEEPEWLDFIRQPCLCDRIPSIDGEPGSIHLPRPPPA